MRIIDADELKSMKFSCGMHNDDYVIYVPLREVMENIDKAKTVGGWISVKDDLPKSVANKVLVWLEHDDLAGYVGYAHYENYKGFEAWFDLEHSNTFEPKGYKVTHWMPLPEPPKEDK